MTKNAALQSFFSQFLDSYAASAVPEDVTFPYLTYENTLGGWGEQTSLTVNLWYYTETETEPNAKAQEIASAIGLGGVILTCDGGAIWLKRGSPWVQNLTDETNKNIKRRYLNVTAEFLTMD